MLPPSCNSPSTNRHVKCTTAVHRICIKWLCTQSAATLPYSKNFVTYWQVFRETDYQTLHPLWSQYHHMNFLDTVPILHVSSTQGACRTSGPPENHNININLMDPVPTYITLSVRRLLVTANVVPSSQIVTLMMVALRSPEMSVLTRATQRNISENGILHRRHRNLKSYTTFRCVNLLW
jgi:hypothetical protein